MVGGTASPITTYPFQVALWSPAAPSPYDGQFCGAAIIDATHVATAAHCIFDDTTGQVIPPESVEVLAGTAHLRNSGDPPYPAGVENVAVSATSFDPSYDVSVNDYDVGVLTLASPLYSGSPPLDGTTSIAPVPLVTSGQAASFANPSLASPVSVSGWGDINVEPTSGQPNPSYPQDLRAAQTHLVADATCQQDYAGVGPITARMLCAGEPGGGISSCFGDSGGPLVAQASSPAPAAPTDDVLVGLVDFGVGCAQPGFPDVFQRVANPDLSAFLTSAPPQAPVPIGKPTLSGTPSPGQTLNCGTGPWAANPTSFSYQFGTDLGSAGAVALTQASSNNSYTAQASDTGTQIFCQVRATNAGGYGYADSADVTIGSANPGPASPAPTPILTTNIDTKRPSLAVAAKSCVRGRCVVNVRVTDPIPSSGIRTVETALRWKTKITCRRHGRRATCTRAHIRHPKAKPIGGGHFLISAAHLKRGSYTLTLNAIDKAGNRQRRPTIVSLRVH